jgi:hypothetical protein
MPGARGIVGYSNIERCSSIGNPKMNNVQEKVFRGGKFPVRAFVTYIGAASLERSSIHDFGAGV